MNMLKKLTKTNKDSQSPNFSNTQSFIERPKNKIQLNDELSIQGASPSNSKNKVRENKKFIVKKATKKELKRREEESLKEEN